MTYRSLYDDSYALLVGINRYTDGRFVPLGEAQTDALRLANLLERPPFSFHVTTLLGAEATRQAIQEALYGLQSTSFDDRILVYFAGHGYTLVDRFGQETGYLACYDTAYEKHFTALELEEVTDLRRRAPAKHVAFVFDACFSGQALGLTRAVSSVSADKFLMRRAYQVISAGAGDQTVADFESMTDLMVERLQRGSVHTINSLGLYLQQTMAAQSGRTQIPQFGHLQGSQGGDFVFEEQPTLDEASVAELTAVSLPPAEAQITAEATARSDQEKGRTARLAGLGASILTVVLLLLATQGWLPGPKPTPTGAPTATTQATPGDVDATVVPLGPLDRFTALADVFTSRESWPLTLSWSPDAAQLAGVMANGSVLRWEGGVSLPRQVFQPPEDPVRFIAADWSSTGRLALSADDNTFDVWDANRGMLGPFLDAEMTTVGDVEWSPDGALLATIATAGAGGQVRLWDLSEMPPTLLDTRVMEANPDTRTLSFSPMGTRIAGASSGIGLGGRERVFIWDTLSGVELRAMEAAGGFGTVRRTAWSPGGLSLAAVLNDDANRQGTVEVFDVRSGEPIAALHELNGAPAVVYDAAWSPDGALLAIAGGVDGALVWHVDGGRLERLAGPSGSVLAVAWAPTEGGNSSLLAAGTSTGAVFLWQWDLR